MTELTEADDLAARERWAGPGELHELKKAFAAHRVKAVLAGREAMRDEAADMIKRVWPGPAENIIRAIPLEPEL